ncbi:MAG: hypothetical protein EPN46_01105 [Candidimonas sp.]|nr:MAG: hypothetical protein EPN62_01385 [Candidimonas sp.]TAM80695.1 MAG: hypothetical protein EPN46_01105 [Candidimonas sp.]
MDLAIRYFDGLDRDLDVHLLYADQSLLSIDAAMRDQGIVLTSPWLVEEELALELLVEPFTQFLPLDSGFYLVHQWVGNLRPAVHTLMQWLIQHESFSTRK